MIRLAKNLGQTDFSTTDIRHFYELLAPQDPTTTSTDTRHHIRHRKRPTRRQEEEQHRPEEVENHGEEN